MLTYEEEIKQVINLRLKYNHVGETEKDVMEHIICQFDDGMIGTVERNGVVVAYADYLWLKDTDDVFIYDQTGVIPNGRVGDMLYINDLVIDSDDKSVIWELWKRRPASRVILWKRKDGKLKEFKNKKRLIR